MRARVGGAERDIDHQAGPENVNDQTDSQSAPTFDQGGLLLDRPSGVACPNCDAELVIGKLQRCQFAGCPQCRGMLLQQDVFGMLIQHFRAASDAPREIPKPLDPNELSVRRTCPSCDRVLETHAYAGPGNAVVDTCFPCGMIWLDEGELTKLVRAPGKR